MADIKLKVTSTNPLLEERQVRAAEIILKPFVKFGMRLRGNKKRRCWSEQLFSVDLLLDGSSHEKTVAAKCKFVMLRIFKNVSICVNFLWNKLNYTVWLVFNALPVRNFLQQLKDFWLI